MTCVPSSGGRIFVELLLLAQLGDARFELVHAARERLRLALVARRAVAAGQLVELVEQVAGVAHVAAHRAVGPAHRGRCGSAGAGTTSWVTSSTTSFG